MLQVQPVSLQIQIYNMLQQSSFDNDVYNQYYIDKAIRGCSIKNCGVGFRRKRNPYGGRLKSKNVGVSREHVGEGKLCKNVGGLERVCGMKLSENVEISRAYVGVK